MLPRKFRLTRKRDFSRVYQTGQKAASRWLLVRALANRRQAPRFAIIIGKKVEPKAVVRNRLKRLVRQALQELLAQSPSPTFFQNKDYILTIHHDPLPPYTLERLRPEVEQCFARLPLN